MSETENHDDLHRPPADHSSISGSNAVDHFGQHSTSSPVSHMQSGLDISNDASNSQPLAVQGEEAASKHEGAFSGTADPVTLAVSGIQISQDAPDSIDAGVDVSRQPPEPPDIYDGIEALAGPPARDATTPVPRSTKMGHTDQRLLAKPEVLDNQNHELLEESSELRDEVPVGNDEPTTEADDDSRSEIQSIMEQFEAQDEGGQDLSGDSIQHEETKEHPPRHSSLVDLQSVESPTSPSTHQFQVVGSPVKTPSLRRLSLSQTNRTSSTENVNTQSSIQSPALNKALPPAPDPEPDLPFDFHRFLEQLRHRTADSVAKYLRSFLTEFGKKQWMVHEQVKIISDFLVFISNKMALCEIWRGVSDAEFDNAREGMEKLVMNRLYSQTFSPAIPPPVPLSPPRGKSRSTSRQPGPGRRGQHQEDVERDEVLAQKVRIYGWIREEHLDINPVGKTGQRFLALAQQELLKIKAYRAPRDKVICVLNCCKVIFGLLRNSKDADTSADAFVPLLIYVILRANPEHLVSNVQYISRFRNPDKLGGEAGYYLSSLMGAIQFIESLDRTALTISDEEFENNVEAAVSAIAERKSMDMAPAELPASTQLLPPQGSEKGDRTPRSSSDLRQRPIFEGSSSLGPETPVGGLLKSIQKPLTSIGRMFSDETPPGPPERPSHRVASATESNPRLSPAVFQPPRPTRDTEPTLAAQPSPVSPRLRAAEAAARQASVETAEAQQIQRAEHHDVVETLVGMFPNLDRDVISDVVRMKNGRVGSAVDACLALNG